MYYFITGMFVDIFVDCVYVMCGRETEREREPYIKLDNYFAGWFSFIKPLQHLSDKECES